MTSTVRTTSATRRPRSASYGAQNHQRHAQHRLVDEEAVRALAMVAQALAVIADHDDHRPVEQPLLLEEGADSADLRIDEGDLAEVRSIGKASAVRVPAARTASARRRNAASRRSATTSPSAATRAHDPPPRCPASRLPRARACRTSRDRNRRHSGRTPARCPTCGPARRRRRSRRSAHRRPSTAPPASSRARRGRSRRCRGRRAAAGTSR